jgi:hypothetical protein
MISHANIIFALGQMGVVTKVAEPAVTVDSLLTILLILNTY